MAQQDSVFRYSKKILALFGHVHATSSTEELCALIEFELSQASSNSAVGSKPVRVKQKQQQEQSESIQRGFTSSGRPEFGEFMIAGSHVCWCRRKDGEPTIYTPLRGSVEDAIQDYLHCFFLRKISLLIRAIGSMLCERLHMSCTLK